MKSQLKVMLLIAGAFALGILFQKYLGIGKTLLAMRHFIAGFAAQDQSFRNESPFYDLSLQLTITTPESSRKPAASRFDKILAATLEKEDAFLKEPQVQQLYSELGAARINAVPAPIEIASSRYYIREYVDDLSSPQTEDRIEESASSIAEFSDWLELRGITLIYLPLPNKLDVETPWLLRDTVYVSSSPARSKYINSLLSKGVIAIDLRRKFGAESLTGRFCFHPLDHHWNSRGIEIAANEIFSAIPSPIGTQWLENISRFSTKNRTIDEPASRINLAPPGTHPASAQISEVHFDSKPIKQDHQSPILVVGDSMALHLSQARQGVSADIASNLARLVGRPLRFVGRDGDSSNLPSEIAKIISKQPTPPSVIVWVRNGALAAPACTPPPTSSHSQTRPPARTGLIAGTIREFPTIPDPQTTSYKDALVRFKFFPSSGENSDEGITCLAWAFKGRILSKPLAEGDLLQIEIETWESALRNDHTLEHIQIIGAPADLTSDEYFVIDR